MTDLYLIGWDHEELGELPTRQLLDDVVIDRPVFLWRVCAHIAAVNTKAFQVCDIPLANPPKQSDGEFEVDKENVATGIVKEQSTQLLLPEVEDIEPALRKQYIKRGLRECLQSGITSVQTNDENCFEM